MRYALVGLGLLLAACSADTDPPAPTVTAVTPRPTATPWNAEQGVQSEAGIYWLNVLRDPIDQRQPRALDLCIDAAAALTDPGSSDLERADSDLLTDNVCLPAMRGEWLRAQMGVIEIRYRP